MAVWTTGERERLGRKRFNHGWLAEVFKKERNDCCQWRLGLKAVILNSPAIVLLWYICICRGSSGRAEVF